jgi:PAS domain S-box-containing protein
MLMFSGKYTRETILVVEDDTGIAELEQKQLERAGFTVVTAATSGEAMDRLRQQPVDLVLLDYRLPGDIDGLDVYLEWKAMGFEWPVILVTAFSNEAVAIRALRAGVRDLITKSAEYLDYLPEAVGRVLKQVRTERRLAESEARLTSIIDSAKDAIIITEAGFQIALFNQTAEAMFRCPAGHALGQPVSRFIPEVSHTGLERPADDSQPAQGPSLHLGSFGDRGMRIDGTEFPVELSVSRTEVGGRRFYTVIVRDITERKLAEEAMRRRLELQQQLAMIAESVPGVICSFRLRPDGSACMPFAMPAIEDLYGIPAGVLAEDFSPVYSNVHPDDIRDLRASVNDAFRRCASWHYRFRYLHPVKGERWIEGWSRAQAEPDGSVLGHGFLMDVTDREQAEVARRESERTARSVLDSLSSPIAVLDASGTILTVNRSWRMFAEENEAVGQVNEGANYLQVCDSATGEDREIATAFATGVRDVLAGHRAFFEREYPCHSPSQRRWFIGRVSPFLEGGPRRVVVAHLNITARKCAEEQLRERERMLAQSQRMARVGSWELDLDDLSDLHPGALRWSDECFHIFGYEPGQVAVTNDLFFEAVHPDDRGSVTAEIARAVRENSPCAIEHRIAYPDGTERIVFEWGEIITDPSGRPIRILGTCQDITQRKRIEQDLRYQLRLNRTITEKVGESIFLTDEQGRLLFMNEEATWVFGFTFEELAGTVLHDAIHHHYPDGRPFPWEECPSARVCRTGEVVRNREDVYFRKDGSAVDAVCANAPLEIDDRRIGVVFILHDITERKRAERALQRRAKRLEHLRKLDRAILSLHSPREIAEAALGHLARLVPYWTACVAVYDFDRDEVEVIATDGLLREWHPPGTRFHGELKARPEIDALLHGQVSTEGEVRGTESTSPLMEALRAAGMQSYVSIPLREGGRPVGSLLLVSDRPAAFSTDRLEMVQEVADHLAIAIRQALLLDEVRSAKVRLETLSRQLIRAQEDERRRIAHELHDEVGQSLTAVKIALDRLARDPSAPDRVSRLVDAATMTGHALEQVRDLSRLLRPSLLDDLGLAEALRALVEGLADRTGLGTEAEVDEIGPVDPEIETACYRIAQEALTNAIKHAGATRLRVALHRIGDDLDLVVADDGTGFDVAAAMLRAVGGSSLGILGLQERAILAGGWAEIISSHDCGTRVHAVVPAKGREGGLHAGGECG